MDYATRNPGQVSGAKTRGFIANFDSLDSVREFVGAEAEGCGFQPEGVYAVQLAVDEAFTNIVEHSYGGESSEEIECTCEIGNDRLTIILRDCGEPFDPTSVPEPDLMARLEDRETGGLGLYFIRKLMDEVHYSYRPDSHKGDGCNTVTLVKRKEK